MKILQFILFVFITGIASGQEQINESMPFQSDPNKKYSLFIPSNYEEGVPVTAFLALHPFNTSRWNGETWCEELADFAESNGVFLICPDGGVDGKIDDAIDTAFTSFLLDSVFQWYDIDETQLYATGFSWGGKTTYTYGLNHIEKFAGLMPIGAAISIGEINGIAQNAQDVPVYIIHGSFDNPNIRYYPLLQAMNENEACVESILLDGVGHTIDFEDQVEILTNGYNYLKNNACSSTSTNEQVINQTPILSHTWISQNDEVEINSNGDVSWQIFTLEGKKIRQGIETSTVMDLTNGTYIIRLGQQSQLFTVH
ncbi:MAG: hypothetical protein P1U56_12030 [Saprospiraceae bacterium]|nr:hypothetical protein [Saprospiraceae bacterium]